MHLNEKQQRIVDTVSRCDRAGSPLTTQQLHARIGGGITRLHMAVNDLAEAGHIRIEANGGSHGAGLLRRPSPQAVGA